MEKKRERKKDKQSEMISKAGDSTTTRSCKTTRVLCNKLHKRLDHFLHPDVLTVSSKHLGVKKWSNRLCKVRNGKREEVSEMGEGRERENNKR